MSLVHAEKLIAAAELAFDGTDFDCADLLCRNASRLWKKAVVGKTATKDEFKRVEAIASRQCTLQAKLATARRAGFHVVRAQS